MGCCWVDSNYQCLGNLIHRAQNARAGQETEGCLPPIVGGQDGGGWLPRRSGLLRLHLLHGEVWSSRAATIARNSRRGHQCVCIPCGISGPVCLLGVFVGRNYNGVALEPTKRLSSGSSNQPKFVSPHQFSGLRTQTDIRSL